MSKKYKHFNTINRAGNIRRPFMSFVSKRHAVKNIDGVVVYLSSTVNYQRTQIGDLIQINKYLISEVERLSRLH